MSFRLSLRSIALCVLTAAIIPSIYAAGTEEDPGIRVDATDPQDLKIEVFWDGQTAKVYELWRKDDLLEPYWERLTPLPGVAAEMGLIENILGKAFYEVYSLADVDTDGLADDWELEIVQADLTDDMDDIYDVSGADDFDGDGLWNELEYQLGSIGASSITNSDGFNDGYLYYQGYRPGSEDYDGDGISNATELLNGTNIFSADSDGDGVNDNLDAYPLDPDRTAEPAGNPSDVTAPIIQLMTPDNATVL